MRPVPKSWCSKGGWWGLLAFTSFTSLTSFAAGAALAWHHPASPVAALIFFYLSCTAAAVWPGIWLVAVPAGLPWLNFSPWTGWLVFEEFDLLLLGVFAGAYARMAWQAIRPAALHTGLVYGNTPRSSISSERVFAGLVFALAANGVTALYRGFENAGGFAFDWFHGYTDPLNSLRVFKSLLFALLTLPLLSDEMRISKDRASRRLALGMALGLACVTMVVLWERLAYPGLLNFSTVYRATALFWEMHVGGGAIDAYLVMATPFALFCLLNARRPLFKVSSAILALLTAYACLMTFSRGVYVAAVLPLLLVGAAWESRRPKASAARVFGPAAPLERKRGRTRKTFWLLGLALMALVAGVLGQDTFMMNRLVNTDRVFGGRLLHWQQAAALLQSRSDWLFGMGLGRFPANYDQRAREGKFSGSVQLQAAETQSSGRNFVTIKGAVSEKESGGLFALTQRVDIQSGVRYQARMDIRVAARTLVAVQLCERHLLYKWGCQQSLLRVEALPLQWQHYSLQLGGNVFPRAAWYAPRLGMLSVAIVNTDGAADIGNIGLMAPDKKELLANGGFSNGLAYWFPAAQYHFLPWHSDSLYLELLIDRGLAGLLIFLALILFALLRLLLATQDSPLAPYLAASLGAALLIGVVISLMDVPRVAFLLYFLSFFSVLSTERRESERCLGV